jgi:hypothetical protein
MVRGLPGGASRWAAENGVAALRLGCSLGDGRAPIDEALSITFDTIP